MYRKWCGRGGGQLARKYFYCLILFVRLEVVGSWYKMQVNQEQTPLPPSLESIEEAIIEQVLRLSLEIENSRMYCESNGLPHRYRKLIKNMKMGKSKQKCTVCMEGFQVDQPIKRLPCGHIFHSHCAKAWLRVNRRCPLCRLDLELHYQTLEMTNISKQEPSCAALS